MPETRAIPSRRKRLWLWLAGGLGLPVVFLFLLLCFFPWDRMRPYISERVSNTLGRPFEMRGPLDVDLGWQTRIHAKDLYLGNAPWGSETGMASLGQLELTLSLSELFHRRIALSQVVLSKADVLLEQDGRHGNNWQFKENEGGDAGWPLSIGQLRVQDGRVRYRDPGQKTEITVLVDVRGKEAMPVQATISGRYRDLKTAVQVQGGSLLSLRNRAQAYPLQAQGQIGDTRFHGAGTVTDPLLLAGLSLEFDLQGRSMAELYRILNLPLPATPPYQLAGHLSHERAVWALKSFSGRVGGSDLTGDFSVDKSRQPQYISADLVSRRLDLKDLSGFIGAREQDGDKAAQPPGKVLPYGEFNLDKLRAADMDVRFKGQHIVTDTLPFNALTAHLKLKDSQLQLDPLELGVAGGNVGGRLTLDARDPQILTKADLTLKRVQLRELFPKLSLQKANVGLIGGRAKLTMRGNSVARMLAQSDGNVTLLMNGGAVSKLLLRLSNLDVANTMVILLAGDEQVPVRCMVADMGVQQGDMQVRTLVLDTDKQLVVGTGNVSLRDEKLNLQLKAKPKDVSLAALRGPILVQGSFAKPVVRPQLGQAAGRLTLSALLAGVTGPLALLPLVQLGSDGEEHCSGLAGKQQVVALQQPAKR